MQRVYKKRRPPSTALVAIVYQTSRLTTEHCDFVFVIFVLKGIRIEAGKPLYLLSHQGISKLCVITSINHTHILLFDLNIK